MRTARAPQVALRAGSSTETNTEARRREAPDLYGVLPPETGLVKWSLHTVVHSGPFARSARCPPKPTQAPRREATCRMQLVRAQLERILASEVFSRSQQLRRFLSFIVEQSLAGQGHSLKESVLAHELYGKGTDFDGGTDPVVRVDARRLRDKLREYYQGRSDPVVISLPKGSYVPAFEANSASAHAHGSSGCSPGAEADAVGSQPQAREARRRRSGGRRCSDRRRARLARSPSGRRALQPSCSPWPRTQVWRGRLRYPRTATLSPSPGRATPRLVRRTSM